MTTPATQLTITIPEGAPPGSLLQIPIRGGKETVQARVPEGVGAGSTLVLTKLEGSDEWVEEVVDVVRAAGEWQSPQAPEEEKLPEISAPPPSSLQLLPQTGGPQAPPVAGPVAYTVRLDTSVGVIDIIVRPDWAPHGARRFLDLAASGDLDDMAFYRSVKGCLAQFGLPAKRPWPALPDDPPTGVPFLLGAVCFAAVGQNSRKSTLFICIGDMSHNFGQQSWETPIGAVAESSLDVLDRIETIYGDIAECNGAGPDTGRINVEGNGYLRQDFPLLTYIRSACPLDWQPPAQEAPEQFSQAAQAAEAAQAAQAAHAAEMAAQATEAIDAARADVARAAQIAQAASSDSPWGRAMSPGSIAAGAMARAAAGPQHAVDQLSNSAGRLQGSSQAQQWTSIDGTPNKLGDVVNVQVEGRRMVDVPVDVIDVPVEVMRRPPPYRGGQPPASINQRIPAVGSGALPGRPPSPLPNAVRGGPPGPQTTVVYDNSAMFAPRDYARYRDPSLVYGSPTTQDPYGRPVPGRQAPQGAQQYPPPQQQQQPFQYGRPVPGSMQSGANQMGGQQFFQGPPSYAPPPGGLPPPGGPPSYTPPPAGFLPSPMQPQFAPPQSNSYVPAPMPPAMGGQLLPGGPPSYQPPGMPPAMRGMASAREQGAAPMGSGSFQGPPGFLGQPPPWMGGPPQQPQPFQFPPGGQGQPPPQYGKPMQLGPGSYGGPLSQPPAGPPGGPWPMY